MVNPAPTSTGAGAAKGPAAEKAAPPSPTPPEGDRAKGSKASKLAPAGKSGDGTGKPKK